MTDPSREPSFLHPIDSVTRDGAHRSRSSHPSLNSTSSWVYHNQQNPPPPPPPEPIPVPSPSRNALGVSEVQDEDEFEGMDINVADIESGTMRGRRVESPLSASTQKRDRNFVGGFVSGLKRLPRTVMKGYGRGQGGEKKRKGTLDTSATSGTGNTLPRYQTTAPEPEAGPSGAVYVEATPMPTARPAAINRRPNRPSLRISNPTEIPDVNDGPQPVHVPELQDAGTTGGQCDPLPPPVRPENILDEGITASPVLVEPRRASDYAKMDSPAPGPPSEPSLGTQINRVQKFMHDLNSLPWVAGDRLTVDYHPGLTRGGKPRSHVVERPPDPQPAHRPPDSWYRSPHHYSVDLLSGASSPISPRAQTERHRPRRQASADMYRRETSPIIPSPYPFQLPYQYPYPVPNAPPSSHQRAHASPHPGSGRSTPHSPGSERHRQATYPTYPHGYSPYSPLPPQPFYVIQGGSGSVNGLQMQQAQALPLYVVATTPVSFSPPTLDHAADHFASPSQHQSRSSPIPRPPPAQTT